MTVSIYNTIISFSNTSALLIYKKWYWSLWRSLNLGLEIINFFSGKFCRLTVLQLCGYLCLPVAPGAAGILRPPARWWARSRWSSRPPPWPGSLRPQRGAPPPGSYSCNHRCRSLAVWPGACQPRVSIPGRSGSLFYGQHAPPPAARTARRGSTARWHPAYRAWTETARFIHLVRGNTCTLKTFFITLESW